MGEQVVRMRSIAFGAALAALAAPMAATAQTEPAKLPMPSKDPTEFTSAAPKPSSVKGDFTLIAIGDMLYSHPYANTTDPELRKVLDIVKSGDVTVTNQEGVFMDLKTFKGSAYGNGQLWGSATLAKDMKDMGIDILSVANNHSTDFGWEGMIESMRLLDEAGVKHSGGGMNLKEAMAPAYFDTPKGRVSLVSTSSTVKPNARANDAFGETNARPGISTLRLRRVELVTPEQMVAIRKLATDRAQVREPAPAADAKEVTLGERIYRVRDKEPAEDAIHWDMDLYDHAGLLKSVKDAKAQSDLAVFTIHAHESPTGVDDDNPPPPNFLIKLFRDVVDAGGDVVVGGGPHSLRGIEIYKGKPIFYGVGVFFIRGEIKALQETALRVFPDPATGKAPPPKPEERSVRPGGNPASWYDSMVAAVDYKGGKAVKVRLYPLDVGNTYDRSRRGIPYLADATNAKRILTDLQKFSAPFGTKIAIEGSVGVINIP